MTKSFSVCLSAALAAVWLLAPVPAAADTVPVLKERVDVQGELVTLGDLFENAGAIAHVAVFRAPDLGTQGMVSARRVAAAAERHGLQWTNQDGIEQVTVRRPSRVVGLEEMADLIRARLAAEIGVEDADAIDLELDRGATPIHLEPDITESLVVRHLSFEPRSGAVRAVVGLPEATHDAPERTFHGRARETVAVAVPAQAIARGATINPGDVTLARLAKTMLPADAETDQDALIGMAARRALAAGRPVRRADLERPKLVYRNAHVAIVYAIPGLTLRSVGRALADGAAGDSVTVLNTQSNRTIQAQVTGPGEVAVTSAFARAPAARAERRTAGAVRHLVR